MSRNCITHGLCLSLGLLGACASGGQNLEPASAARTVTGLDRAAVATDHAVQVIAQTAKWPGDARITRDVEPVRVRITNNSGEPVSIRYEEFKLTANDGETYTPIPSVAVSGEVQVKSPLFTYTRYAVAPYYVAAYPGVSSYTGPFAYHRAYYDTYAGYWGEANLPTVEMLAWALPEGVLEDGGYVDGYLYFPRIPSSKDQVRFQAKLTPAASESPEATAPSSETATAGKVTAPQRTVLASVSIPFTVE